MRFRSKPVEIEAVQWDGKNDAEVSAFCGTRRTANGRRVPVFAARDAGGPWATMWCEKSCAWVHPPVDAWIIREPDGSGYYPCAADVFAARWERLAGEGNPE